MSTQISIVVRDNGSLVCLDTETNSCFRALGKVTTRRASHVVPINKTLCAIFYFLRKYFGEKGWMAEFTRMWKCKWLVDLRPVGGPVMFGPFIDRQHAIDAEIEWLNQNLE